MSTTTATSTTVTAAPPMQLFADWLATFKGGNPKCEVPMCLSTVEQGSDDSLARPVSRIVLLKFFEPVTMDGRFTFFTNYDSRKGRNLAANPHCALNFFWGERQVRVEGVTLPATPTESDAYFAHRPRQSQIGAWASLQSRTMPGGAQELADRVVEMERRFASDETVPRPPNWGGFHVVPTSIEFWEAHPYRLHTRRVFERTVSLTNDGTAAKVGPWGDCTILYP